jgi:DNA-binding CsgD family transcriptional regulator
VKKAALVYGVCGGLVIAALRATEYRFLVVERSIDIYVGLIALICVSAGLWVGLWYTKKPEVVVREVPVETSGPFTGPFIRNDAKVAELGITPRELEILEHIASGKSTREIAAALFVSENTVKTHASRLFDKLSVNRRTQAVQVAKSLGLIS